MPIHFFGDLAFNGLFIYDKIIFEFYKNGLIFYSLGGLTFGDHYKNNILKALPRKTKFSGIPILSTQPNFYLNNFISTRELPANYISIINKNIINWSNRRWIVQGLNDPTPIL